MAYIGKVTLSSEWEKLEDLIKAQIDGQSSFSFDASKEYFLQTDTPRGPYIFGAYMCDSSSEPSEPNDGEHLEQEMSCVYKPDAGYLWVKKRGQDGDVKVSVSELG